MAKATTAAPPAAGGKNEAPTRAGAAPSAADKGAEAPKPTGFPDLHDGDVIRFDYKLWVAGQDGLVDTSIEAAAREEGVLRPTKTYRPLTVTLGRGTIIPGLEREIRAKAKLDTPVTVNIPAAAGYGNRDPGLIKDVPMAQFKKQKVEPRVGMELTMQGRPGVVTRVAGGRVRVDLNHELAGKELRYEFTLRQVLRTEQEKVEGILSTFFPRGGQSFSITKDAVTIELPPQVNFDQNWTMGKFRVLQDLRAAVGDRAVRFVETYPATGPGSTTGHFHGDEWHEGFHEGGDGAAASGDEPGDDAGDDDETGGGDKGGHDHDEADHDHDAPGHKHGDAGHGHDDAHAHRKSGPGHKH